MTMDEKRQRRYPNTSTFVYHNANPKKKLTTDCVIRALSTAMEKPYQEVVMELAQLQCETGYAALFMNTPRVLRPSVIMDFLSSRVPCPTSYHKRQLQ